MFDPLNFGERLFAMVTHFHSFLISCLFVSSVTTALTRLQFIRSAQSGQLSKLKRFLGERGICSSLASRVQLNARHALAEGQRNLPEHDVELLAIVSESLRAELHLELNAPVLLTYPFLALYFRINQEGLRSLCHSTVSHQACSAGDIVFCNLETPVHPHMFFVRLGMLSYTQPHRDDESVGPGDYLAEATLWTHWMHRGTLRATTDSQLLTLDSEKFQEIVGPFPTQHPQCYACAFVEELNVANRGEDANLSDLRGDLETEDKMLSFAFPEFFSDETSGGMASMEERRAGRTPFALIPSISSTSSNQSVVSYISSRSHGLHNKIKRPSDSSGCSSSPRQSECGSESTPESDARTPRDSTHSVDSTQRDISGTPAPSSLATSLGYTAGGGMCSRRGSVFAESSTSRSTSKQRANKPQVSGNARVLAAIAAAHEGVPAPTGVPRGWGILQAASKNPSHGTPRPGPDRATVRLGQGRATFRFGQG